MNSENSLDKQLTYVYIDFQNYLTYSLEITLLQKIVYIEINYRGLHD